MLCVGLFAACSGGNDVSADTTPADTTTADTTTPPEDEKWPEVEGTVIYVDGTAEDGGDGSKDTPFKSITEAQAKIREIKAGDGLPEGGITVLLASGEYRVTETISFNEEDSGTAESPIRYMSAEKNGAVLTGGISIPASEFSPLSEEEKALINDEAAKDKVLKIDLTRYGISGTGYDFFINGERLYLSRYPNVSVEDPYLRTGENDKTTNFKILAISEFEEQAVAIKERGKNWDINTLRTGGYLGATYSFEIHTVKELDLETLS
ncbi:MAG: hypothetical protein IKV54_02945, partial [Clostridia bacterium]|nr:hypothetical protein [Clostridia bacterium]